jgi:signal peptidase I
MRRLLVLPICLALAVAGCTQESSDTSVGNPVTTTVVVDTTSSTVVTTTSLAHATTVSLHTAAEAAEAFNASMATVVELSVLLIDEFEALATYLEEHRTELSEGAAIDTCCGARIERINVYDRLMAEEIASLYGQTSNLTSWVEELSYSLLRGGQQGLKGRIESLDEWRMHLAMHLSEIAWESDTFHVDTAIGLLYDSHSDARTIAQAGEFWHPIALNSSTMEDTIQIDGRLTVDRDDTDPQRSDIIKFSNPFYETAEFTARIVALPTETVEGREDGVYVNDRLLSEPYVKDGNTGQPFTVRTLKADEYWVMGDNRGAVDQDRFLRLITAAQIIGTVTDIENP